MSLSEILSTQLFSVSGTPVTVTSVLFFGVIMLLTYWLSALLRRVVGRTMAGSGLSDPGTTATVLRLLHYTVLLTGFAVAVQMIGLSLTSLFAAGAVVAVAIGFALQNVLQNFVAGVILLAERSIKEHDVLEVEGEQIVVERLGARATVGRTHDDDQIIIPNSVLVQSSVTNLTLGDNVHRVRAQVGVAYESDMEEVERVLLASAVSIGAQAQGRGPVALLREFGDSSVVWEVSIWITEPWKGPRVRSDLNKSVWKHLKEAGITIAFPQVDVHMVPPSGA